MVPRALKTSLVKSESSSGKFTGQINIQLSATIVGWIYQYIHTKIYILKLGCPAISSCTEESQGQFQIQRNWASHNVPVLCSYRNISKLKKSLNSEMFTGDHLKNGHCAELVAVGLENIPTHRYTFFFSQSSRLLSWTSRDKNFNPDFPESNVSNSLYWGVSSMWIISQVVSLLITSTSLCVIGFGEDMTASELK